MATERTVTDVVEFTLTEDGKQLVYAVGARDSAKNGVFAVKPGGDRCAGRAARQARASIAKLTWDENQTQLVFLSDRDDTAAKQPKWKLYRWDRQAPPRPCWPMPIHLVSARNSSSATGAPSASPRTARASSSPALRPAREEGPSRDDAADDKAVVDLWSYKDDYIQPMQKVRAERDRNRTFTAAYLIPERKIVQLADAALETVTPSESAQWILGTDDREYRPHGRLR